MTKKGRKSGAPKAFNLYNASPGAKPPGVLYHYTDSAGLLGIIDSVKLWATDLGYLNDTSEQDYGLEMGFAILVEAVEKQTLTSNSTDQLDDIKLQIDALPPEQRKMLEGKVQEAESRLASTHRDFEETLRKFKADYVDNFATNEKVKEARQQIFLGISCFCENGDSLGHWRGYGGPGGYALGFDSSALGRLVAAKNLPLRPVVYKVKKQRRILGEIITDFLANKTDLTPDLPVDFMGVAAQIKHPAFAEEKEWRIGDIEICSKGNDSLRFRNASLGPTPYLELDLAEKTGRLPLTSVVIGPGNDFEPRARAIRALLIKKGYDLEYVDIVRSKVPFRDM